MLEPKIVGELVAFPRFKQAEILFDKLFETIFEILSKQRRTCACEQGENMIIILLQMRKKVRKGGVRRFAGKYMPVRCIRGIK